MPRPLDSGKVVQAGCSQSILVPAGVFISAGCICYSVESGTLTNLVFSYLDRCGPPFGQSAKAQKFG